MLPPPLSDDFLLTESFLQPINIRLLEKWCINYYKSVIDIKRFGTFSLVYLQ